MKIAVIDPQNLVVFFGSNVHAYIVEFLKRYRPILFLSGYKYIYRFLRFMRSARLNISDFEVIFTLGSLNSRADVLLYLHGGVYKYSKYLRKFSGLKIYHLMDAHYLAREINELLENCGVDYVMCYSRQDKHSSFFRKMYPSYIGKVIDIPFGFKSMYIETKRFSDRLSKCLGTGTLEPFEVYKGTTYAKRTKDYLDYFSDMHSIHELRFLLDKNSAKLSDILDCRFHHYPQKDNYIEDIVGTLNSYKMFVNDDSLMNFPPARTFEAMACGCVMVCQDCDCYTDYGFIDGKNCIKFQKYDLDDFRDKVMYYLKEQEKLERIQKEGTKFVTENYNHGSIADLMYRKIAEKYKAKQ